MEKNSSSKNSTKLDIEKELVISRLLSTKITEKNDDHSIDIRYNINTKETKVPSIIRPLVKPYEFTNVQMLESSINLSYDEISRFMKKTNDILFKFKVKIGNEKYKFVIVKMEEKYSVQRCFLMALMEEYRENAYIRPKLIKRFISSTITTMTHNHELDNLLDTEWGDIKNNKIYKTVVDENNILTALKKKFADDKFSLFSIGLIYNIGIILLEENNYELIFPPRKKDIDHGIVNFLLVKKSGDESYDLVIQKENDQYRTIMTLDSPIIKKIFGTKE